MTTHNVIRCCMSKDPFEEQDKPKDFNIKAVKFY